MHHWRTQDKPLAKQLSVLLDDLKERRPLSPSSRVSHSLRRSHPYMRSSSLASRHFLRGSPACSHSASIDDMFRLMMEIRDEVAELQRDVTMVQVSLRDFHAEVIAIHDDIASLRGATFLTESS
ncbi:Hypothetical predicted protein [Olea europaea subsp. europaea]|uniref:Uncharacterized protein n=1 Tax=Olea europaea subsp. europaea TaxID=158383 RepID=A0A8S0U0M6_OLEEU|nr:Hypothetical predicted protein [Olea europaea subsp. europaea]